MAESAIRPGRSDARSRWAPLMAVVMFLVCNGYSEDTKALVFAAVPQPNPRGAMREQAAGAVRSSVPSPGIIIEALELGAPSKRIEFSLPPDSTRREPTRRIVIRLLDAAGEPVKLLLDAPLLQGRHVLSFRDVDDAGKPLRKGRYLLEMSGEGISEPISITYHPS